VERVLAVVQFPIADAQRSVMGESSRLPLPDWPPRTHEPPQFVRGFGPSIERKRGADVASIEELTFCPAARAVRGPFGWDATGAQFGLAIAAFSSPALDPFGDRVFLRSS
jgi:hypothetical protein